MSEKTVKLYAPDGKPCFMATVNGGHTFSVSPDGTDVPERFVREAMARGCMPEGMRDMAASLPKNNEEPTQMDVVLRIIEEVVREVDADPTKSTRLLTGDGRPDATELSRRCGFQVPAAMRDEAWDIFKNGGDD